MSGYIIYSLDWDKFKQLIEQPTPQQLTNLAKLLSKKIEIHKKQFKKGYVMSTWGTDVAALAKIVAQRLSLPDWYKDLSNLEKDIWSSIIESACMKKSEIDVGFRVDHAGVSWDAVQISRKILGVPIDSVTDVPLSTFGTRPFRYHPPADEPASGSNPYLPEGPGYDAWFPTHSMHTPDEAKQIHADLKSVESSMKGVSNADTRNIYFKELMPTLERIVADQRMLYVGVDT